MKKINHARASGIGESSSTELSRVLAKLNQMSRDLVGVKGELTKMRSEVTSLRDYQVDQERERHSLMLSAASARSGVVMREPQQTFSGAKFKTREKDWGPAPLYY